MREEFVKPIVRLIHIVTAVAVLYGLNYGYGIFVTRDAREGVIARLQQENATMKADRQNIVDQANQAIAQVRAQAQQGAGKP